MMAATYGPVSGAGASGGELRPVTCREMRPCLCRSERWSLTVDQVPGKGG